MTTAPRTRPRGAEPVSLPAPAPLPIGSGRQLARAERAGVHLGPASGAAGSAVALPALKPMTASLDAATTLLPSAERREGGSQGWEL